MNQEGDCNSPDTTIGIGLNHRNEEVVFAGGAYNCCQQGGGGADYAQNVEVYVDGCSSTPETTVAFGDPSCDGDDCTSTANCPSGYKATDCWCDGNCDGAYVSGDDCVARGRRSGDRTRAGAICSRAVSVINRARARLARR